MGNLTLVILLSWIVLSCSAKADEILGFFAPCEKTQLAQDPSKEPETVTVHEQRAFRLYQEKRYEEASSSIEAALVELPDVDANAERREKLLSMHRLAKAKVLVANYHERLAEIEEAANRRKIIEGLVITQVYGTVWQSEKAERLEVSIGGQVKVQSTFFVLAKSGLEMTSEGGDMIRSVDASVFTFSDRRSIRLNEGAILLHLSKDAQPFHLDGPLAGVNLRSEKASTVLVSVTTSGGLKIIANERDLTVFSNNQEIKLRAGELVFALPEPQGLSRKMDVELSTILMTSDLLTGFEDPVPFSRSLRLAALMQARRIKGRFRAVVGDVETADDFQVKVIDDEEPKDDSKKKSGLSRFFRSFSNRTEDE